MPPRPKAPQPSPILTLTTQELEDLLASLPNKTPKEQAEIAALLEQAETERHLQECRDDFLTFVREMWPGFICGPHHERMAKEFQEIAEGRNGRLTVSLSPRSGKSILTSVYFPAWFLGKYPDRKVLQASHKGELAVGFGRQVREIFMEPKFKQIFPGVTLKADNKAAGRWGTNRGGVYYAAGVGAGLAGFGADLCVQAGTVVETNFGPMAVEDVVRSEADIRVLAFDHKKNEPAFLPVLGRGSRVSDKMIDFRVSGKTIRCTPEHPVWVDGSGYIRADQLKPGDRILRYGEIQLPVVQKGN